MVVCAKLGLNFVACGPVDCMPGRDVIDATRPFFEEYGCTCKLTQDVAEGVAGAHAIYTDVWVSLGEPDEVWEPRIASLQPYRVNSDVTAMADPNAIF